MAATLHKSKPMKMGERMLRQHRSEVRKLKKWCNEAGVKVLTYSEASDEDICALSKEEYDLGDERKLIAEDNESYFLTPDAYEKWCEEF